MPSSQTCLTCHYLAKKVQGIGHREQPWSQADRDEEQTVDKPPPPGKAWQEYCFNGYLPNGVKKDELHKSRGEQCTYLEFTPGWLYDHLPELREKQAEGRCCISLCFVKNGLDFSD